MEIDQREWSANMGLISRTRVGNKMGNSQKKQGAGIGLIFKKAYYLTKAKVYIDGEWFDNIEDMKDAMGDDEITEEDIVMINLMVHCCDSEDKHTTRESAMNCQQREVMNDAMVVINQYQNFRNGREEVAEMQYPVDSNN